MALSSFGISGSKSKSKSSSTRSLPKWLEDPIRQDLMPAATSLFEQGLDNYFLGSRLADEDPLIGQAQEGLLGFIGDDSQFQQDLGQVSQVMRGLLGAGDIRDPLNMRALSDVSDVIGEQFGRVVLPQINQAATGAGQFGSSRQGIAQGLAAGEAANAISRAATDQLLGGRQLAFNAAQAAPSLFASRMLPFQLMQEIGAQRTGRGQLELEDQIQQVDAPRLAEVDRISTFRDLMFNNPLLQGLGTIKGKTKSQSLEVGAGQQRFG